MDKSDYNKTTHNRSTVLLLIIPNPSSSILHHSLFYRLFSPYGEVVKILIFEKSRLWKAFVEMGSPETAKLAQEALNGVTVIDGGVMNVYFSTFKTVTLVNNNSGGVDYRMLKQGMQARAPQYNWMGDYPPLQRVQSQPEITSQPAFRCDQDSQSQTSHQNTYFYPTNFYNQTQQQSFLSDEVTKQRSGTIEHFQADDQLHNIRSRSSTSQTDKTQEIKQRKQLRLYATQFEDSDKKVNSQKELSFELLDEQYDIMKKKESSFQHLCQTPSPKQKQNDTHFDIKSAMTHDDDNGILDLLKDKTDYWFDEQKVNEQYEAVDELTQQDKDIINAFSNDKQFNFMFSIPEVQGEQSSPQHKSNSKQKSTVPLSFYHYPEVQPFNIDVQTSEFPEPNPEQMYCCGFSMDPANYVNPQFLLENQPSNVIYIRGLQNPRVTTNHLFNLFSSCGNIKIIIFIRHKHSALVQFEKLGYAQNAKDNYNNQTFFEQKLKIFYSNYQEISLPIPNASPLTQVYIPSPTQNRFFETKNIVYNPPSQVLHVSNLSKEATKDDYGIRELFQRYGKVILVKFINVHKQKKMAFVKMSLIEEALNAASELHNLLYFGRNLNISFTKSKI